MTHPAQFGLRIAPVGRSRVGAADCRTIRRQAVSRRAASRRPVSYLLGWQAGEPIVVATIDGVRRPGRASLADDRGQSPALSGQQLERQQRDLQIVGAALGIWVLVMLAITPFA